MTLNLWDGRLDTRTPVRQEPQGPLPPGHGQGRRALHLGAPLDQVAGRDRAPAQGRQPRRRGPPGHDEERRGSARPNTRCRPPSSMPAKRPAPATSPTTSSSARPKTIPISITIATTASSRTAISSSWTPARPGTTTRGHLRVLPGQREVHPAPAGDLRSRLAVQEACK